MEYLIIGAVLALGVGGAAAFIGLDRDRAFYPTVLMVIASYYLLFAAIAGSPQAAVVAILSMAAFLIAAIAGFKFNLWWVVVGLLAHGVFDFVHAMIVDNAGVPLWWPPFCLGYDVVAAVGLGCFLKRSARR